MAKKITKQETDFNKLVEYEKSGTLASLIIESADLAIKTKTLEGIITSWNFGAEKIYGYTDSEIIGKNISLLIPPNHIDELHALTKKIGEGHIISHYETKVKRKDGVVIDVSLSLSPIKDKNGNVIGVATLDRDITELIVANKELFFQNQLFYTNNHLNFQHFVAKLVPIVHR